MLIISWNEEVYQKRIWKLAKSIEEMVEMKFESYFTFTLIEQRFFPPFSKSLPVYTFCIFVVISSSTLSCFLFRMSRLSHCFCLNLASNRVKFAFTEFRIFRTWVGLCISGVFFPNVNTRVLCVCVCVCLCWALP